MGDDTDRQEIQTNHQNEGFINEKPSLLMVGDGLENGADSATSGRYWTRTNDPHDVNVVL
jgi:hypothetical protein